MRRNKEQESRTLLYRESDKLVYDLVDEIPLDRLDAPRIIQGQNGKIAFGTDEGVGSGAINKDALVINTQANAFAVIDGLGGEERGDIAARILAEEIQKGFKDRVSAEEVQRRAHVRMISLKVGGACYIAGRIRGSELNIFQAGDVRLVVVGRGGRVWFETKDQDKEGFLNNVGGDNPGYTTSSRVTLDIGDRIVVASDGLWRNFTSKEVARMVAGQPIGEAIGEINRLTKEKMRVKKGNIEDVGDPDNISVVIYDFERIAPND